MGWIYEEMGVSAFFSFFIFLVVACLHAFLPEKYAKKVRMWPLSHILVTMTAIAMGWHIYGWIVGLILASLHFLILKRKQLNFEKLDSAKVNNSYTYSPSTKNNSSSGQQGGNGTGSSGNFDGFGGGASGGGGASSKW